MRVHRSCAQLLCPPLEILAVDVWIQREHAGGVGELSLRITCGAGPLQLRENRVFRSHHRDTRGKWEIDFHTTAELLFTERPIAPNDQIDFAGVRCLDRVELRPRTKRAHRDLAVDIEPPGIQGGDEIVELLGCRIDDDVGGVGRARPAMIAGGHGTGQHERNLKPAEQGHDCDERLLLRIHGSTNASPG